MIQDWIKNKQITHLSQPVRFVKNSKGRRVILYEDFTFHKHTQYKENTYWRCSKKKSMNCLVILKTQGDRVISITGFHDHPPPVPFSEYVDNDTQFD